MHVKKLLVEDIPEKIHVVNVKISRECSEWAGVICVRLALA